MGHCVVTGETLVTTRPIPYLHQTPITRGMPNGVKTVSQLGSYFDWRPASSLDFCWLAYGFNPSLGEFVDDYKAKCSNGKNGIWWRCVALTVNNDTMFGVLCRIDSISLNNPSPNDKF